MLKKINTSLDISVRASLQGDKIVLTDSSGKTTNDLTVQDLAGGTSATDLGISGTVSANTLTGTDINYVSRGTLLDSLNDNRGVGRGTGGNDFTVTLGDGTTVGVNLATAKSVGDVIDAINTAGGLKLKADIVPGSNGIRLTDASGGGGAISIAQNNGSTAAADLGLLTAPSGNVVNGSDVIAGIDTSLISSLRGGSGLSLGQVIFTDRSGASQTIDFSDSNSVQDLLDHINNASGVHLKASLKDSGNGIQITDTSGGSGNLVIADAAGGTTAAELGINGSFNTSQTAVLGANLHKQWMTNNTLLTSLNGGKGISKGHFTITNSAGTSATIDLSGSNVTKVSDLLYQINSKALAGVTASINANGNGIVINDASAGANKLTITDIDSTTAADLNIKGKATGTSIDGAYEKTLTIGANDTLASVQQSINALGFGISASIINDGSATAPYRLSMTALNSGRAGRVVLDAGTTSLGGTNLVNAQDAAVFLGGADSAQPLLVTASSNQITGVIQGVTVNLTGVSQGPVQLSVTRNSNAIVQQLTDFAKNFNDLSDKINTLTQYDSTTNTAGLLLGDSTVGNIQSNMYSMLNTVVTTGGKYRVLADIGLTIDNNAHLVFDSDKFNAAYAADPNSVQQLFAATQQISNPDGTTTTKNLGVAYGIDSQINQLIDPVNGSLTLQNNTLDSEAQNFQDQITQLDSLLSDKRTRLETQFANMESVLAGLQSQQSALSSLTGVTTTSSTTKK